VRARLVLVAVLLVACTSTTSVAEPGSTATGATEPDASGTSPAGEGSTSTSGSGDSMACWAFSELEGDEQIQFEDVTGVWGLIEPLIGMHGHVAAFGDVNTDHQPDLLVGTFGDREPEAYQVREADGPSPDQLMLSPGPAPVEAWSEELGRSSGAVFADFDMDGDDDLLLVRHAGRDGDFDVPTRLFENDGGNLVAHSEPLPQDFRGRTPAVADFDGDGLLDVYVSEDNSGETGGLLLHNDGDLAFGDVTAGSGLEGVLALSAVAGDIDNDQRPDLATSTAVYINEGDLRFADATPDGYEAEPIGEEDDPAGVALGDLDRDGIVDLVIGQHYRATVEFDSEVPVRVFLGTGGGEFQEATDDAGVAPLPTLAPHVDIADIDNDGWPDIVTSASAENGTIPAIYRNTGEIPLRFEPPDDLGSDQYWIGGPVTDFDHDGRLDVFAVEWEPALPSILFRNSGESGHWLEVSIAEPGSGIGYLVAAHAPDDPTRLIGIQEIGVGGGYSSGKLPIAHFGLGEATSASVTITRPDGSIVELGNVTADQHIRWPNGC
jgi:hypothetical protein